MLQGLSPCLNPFAACFTTLGEVNFELRSNKHKQQVTTSKLRNVVRVQVFQRWTAVSELSSIISTPVSKNKLVVSLLTGTKIFTTLTENNLDQLALPHNLVCQPHVWKGHLYTLVLTVHAESKLNLDRSIVQYSCVSNEVEESYLQAAVFSHTI